MQRAFQAAITHAYELGYSYEDAMYQAASHAAYVARQIRDRMAETGEAGDRLNLEAGIAAGVSAVSTTVAAGAGAIVLWANQNGVSTTPIGGVPVGVVGAVGLGSGVVSGVSTVWYARITTRRVAQGHVSPADCRAGVGGTTLTVASITADIGGFFASSGSGAMGPGVSSVGLGVDWGHGSL